MSHNQFHICSFMTIKTTPKQLKQPSLTCNPAHKQTFKFVSYIITTLLHFHPHHSMFAVMAAIIYMQMHYFPIPNKQCCQSSLFHVLLYISLWFKSNSLPVFPMLSLLIILWNNNDQKYNQMSLLKWSIEALRHT